MNKKIIFTIIIIILILIIAFPVFFFINKNKNENKISPEEQEFNNSGRAKAILDPSDLSGELSNLSLLDGKWVSLDDERYILVFDSVQKQRIDYYEKEKTSQENFQLYDSEDLENADGNILKSWTDDDMFEYKITKISDTELEMIYLSRGNILKFKKLNQESKESKTLLETLLETSETEKTNLLPVDGSNSNGQAYRLIKEDLILHSVVADLPDPQDGNSYEGWLVQKSPLKFFSTGVMKKNSDGKWILEFKKQDYSPNYNLVVITLETKVDEIPEKHIIEGEF